MDFSLSRFRPPTSIFSTASSGVKTVAKTNASKAPSEDTTISSTVFLFLDLAVNLFASGDNLENMELRLLLFLIFKSFCCCCFLLTGALALGKGVDALAAGFD
jgi:hypothetical protein